MHHLVHVLYYGGCGSQQAVQSLKVSFPILFCSWGYPWLLLGCSWPHLGFSWLFVSVFCAASGRFGSLLIVLEALMAAVEPRLGLSWAALGHCWATLGALESSRPFCDFER
jgi:hypothetical protein